MELMRIKSKDWEQIQIVAKELARLEKGNRKMEELEQETKNKLIYKYKLPKKGNIKMNKEYNLIYTQLCNIGSAKWIHYILQYWDSSFKFIKETRCYYIEENGHKIYKQKLVAIIEK